MKKLKLVLIIIIVFLLNTNVFAKDTVYSINKYEDEELTYIENSYNEENKIDGFITAGTFLKEQIENNDEKQDNYQIMIVKYKKTGKREWTYRYGKTSSETIADILYTYDSENKVNGYLIIVDNSYDVLTESTPKSLFLRLDLDGKLVSEKEIIINNNETIKKLTPTYSTDSVVDGYIGITNTSIIKLDKELNITQYKENQNINYLDITNIYKDNNVVGYAFIKSSLVDNKNNIELVKYDKNLTEEKTISNLSNYISYKLENTKEGFILYGITKDVKVDGGNNSYYLINYNENGEINWESVGNIALNDKYNIVLYPVIKENSINYFLLYQNKDSSYEIVKLDKEGTLKKKIKKINNGYYKFTSFIIGTKEKDIYIVGQITCPEDEKCDYTSNSLFLVSDEDKVIEVEDSTSTKIIIGITVFILATGYIIYVTRKKKLNKK